MIGQVDSGDSSLPDRHVIYSTTTWVCRPLCILHHDATILMLYSYTDSTSPKTPAELLSLQHRGPPHSLRDFRWPDLSSAWVLTVPQPFTLIELVGLKRVSILLSQSCRLKCRFFDWSESDTDIEDVDITRPENCSFAEDLQCMHDIF